MDPQTIAIIGAAIALAGLNIQLTRGVNRRFDDMNRRFDDMNRRFDDMRGEMNRRFDDAARANDIAHANIVANVSDLRADETGAPAAGAAWKTRPSGSSAGLPSRMC